MHLLILSCFCWCKHLFLRLRTSFKHLNHSTEGKDLEKTDRSLFQHEKNQEESAVSCRRANPPGTKDQPDVLECHKNRSHPTQRGNTCSFKMAVDKHTRFRFSKKTKGFHSATCWASRSSDYCSAKARVSSTRIVGLNNTFGSIACLKETKNCVWKYANILAHKLSPFKVMNSRNQHQIHA